MPAREQRVAGACHRAQAGGGGRRRAWPKPIRLSVGGEPSGAVPGKDRPVRDANVYDVFETRWVTYRILMGT